jgi:hypothetical protein
MVAGMFTGTSGSVRLQVPLIMGYPVCCYAAFKNDRLLS